MKSSLIFSFLLNIFTLVSIPFVVKKTKLTGSDSLSVVNRSVKITPPVIETEEEKFNRHLFWYDYNGLLSITLDSAKSRFTQVKVFLGKEKTKDIHWLRVCYMDCTTGDTCAWRNYAHLKPYQDEKGDWYIEPVVYSIKKRPSIKGLRSRNDMDVGDEKYNYINTFYPICVVEEQRTGIPWPIKLAQGILESGITSSLAVKHGNHFGIKTHRSWNGPVASFGDEVVNGKKKKFNFCHFNNPYESYVYHSNFLMKNKRYKEAWKYTELDSVYSYLHTPGAKNYWNKHQLKPVYALVDGKRTLLQYGKTYKLTGLDCWAVVLSKWGYASNHNYAYEIQLEMRKFKQF